MEKQLPKNWIEVQLIDILEVLENGSRPKGGVQGIFDGVPSLGGEHLDSNGGFKFGKLKYVPTSFAEKMNRGKIKKNDILIVKDGATTGKTSFIDNNFPFDLAFVNEHVFICRTFPNLNSKCIFYFLFGKSGFDRIMDNFTGSAQGGINQKFASNTLIPLPPLAEQNRIVTKLDTLFAQLDTIKASMAKIPVLLKEFRQQVLTQAVIGKLTEEWRKGKELEDLVLKLNINNDYKLDKLPKGWKHGIISDISKVKGGKRLPKGDELVNENTGFPYIRARDLKKGTVLTENMMYLKEETQFKIKNYTVNTGDLYITIVGAKIGDAGIIPEEMNGANLTENAVKITNLHEKMFNEYFSIWLRSTICQTNIQQTIMSAAQGKLALTRINQLPIYLPTLEEQQEIVSRVESLFTKADAIEQQYQSLKEKIDSLPQALLHKAFKGELTKQLESDGDARELLQQIQELKNSTVKPKKATSKKVKKYPENETVLGMVAEAKEELSSKVIKLKPTNSEIYKRTLLAAEIVYQLKDTNTLGHLKLQKMLYLCQEIGSMKLPMNFLKQAMGPYDNQLARSLDKQFVVKKWFEYQNGALLKYKPLENCGNHKEDFQKYFETEVEQINYLINKFKKFTSNQIEAVATLYACWKEAIEQKELITDKLIINKFYQWSKEKEKFREENMIKALGWMRKNGIEPK